MKTSVHQHGELELYSVGDVEAVEFVVHSMTKLLLNFRVLLTMRAAEFIFITRCNQRVTDGRTDSHVAIAITRASIASRG